MEKNELKKSELEQILNYECPICGECIEFDYYEFEDDVLYRQWSCVGDSYLNGSGCGAKGFINYILDIRNVGNSGYEINDKDLRKYKLKKIKNKSK